MQNKAHNIQFLFSSLQANYWNAALVNQNYKAELNQNGRGKFWLDNIIVLIKSKINTNKKTNKS